MPCSLEAYPGLATFLKGDQPLDGAWAPLGITPIELTNLCEAEELWGLLHQRLGESHGGVGWPIPLRNAISQKTRAHAAAELLRAEEIRAVLNGLEAASIRPILLKGTALAYAVYPSPVSRPRNDTDVIIAPEDVEAARRMLTSRGYAVTVQCAELFSQFEVQKMDRFGVLHVLDVHWSISTQPVFAGVFRYDELLSRAEPVPALGASALAPCAVDALLLACIHPIMHHRNVERALWIYDVHLLASTLSEAEFDRFADLAREKQMREVAAHALWRAQAVFGTAIPVRILAALARDGAREPSAEYLASDRKWRDELISSVRGLPSFGERVRLMREVLFPSPQYMLGAYGLRGKPLGQWVLPALYVHRNLRGVWRIFSGHK